MKIAVLTDVHANFVALQAVADHIESWKPDRVIQAGDLVNRGPKPAECLNFAMEKQASSGWLFIRGNHEDYVITQSKRDTPRSGSYAEVHRASIWTYQQLDCTVTDLKEMPSIQEVIDPDGNLVRFVHASILHNRDGIYPETSDANLLLKIGLSRSESKNDPIVFCAGHTHRPLIRTVEGVLVVNAGSAGLPFDGDTRPCYAQLTWRAGNWKAKIVRVNYDFQQAKRDFFECGYLNGGGPLVELVLIELSTATSQLYNWSTRYQSLALAGKISMRQSVDEYLIEQKINKEYL